MLDTMGISVVEAPVILSDAHASLTADHFVEKLHSVAIIPKRSIVSWGSIGDENGHLYEENGHVHEEEEEDEEEEMEYVVPLDIRKDGSIDERDEGTADGWIPRHPSMIRLTGRHPFNSEPPLEKLMEHGFLTPTSLHYVRNHGASAQGAWDSWKVEVCGLVKMPRSFSMDDLLKFQARELPVTLVCAGNRRKEQNMVQQTIGFNWGAAGLSTSIWRGVRLCDLLRACGVLSKKKGARFVCFEGGDKLPAASGSGYGTCISIDKALDVTQDVIIAYMQNGKVLQPDHGFPVRMIIPGFIGGRMVKWLKKIEVTSVESSNYYHYKDNRVLPSHVDAEMANSEGWWFNPNYIINDLNINSVITTPVHGDVLLINPSTLQSPYTLKGYAYSGGGRKVTRVEVSLDDGGTWKICTLNHPEKPTKYGKYWCWCFWQLDVEVIELLQSKQLAVRAWDESLNTQPKDLIWNVMGMMNNCWFKIHVNPCKRKGGGIGLRFEHPTLAGNQSGGWMVKKDEEDQLPLTRSASTPALGKSVPHLISMSEVRKHNKAESCWIVIHNNVYDCTSFLKDHPGGVDSILINAGTDCTEEFDAIHSSKARALLEDFRIGDLLHGSISSDTTPESSLHGNNKALAAMRRLGSIPEFSLKTSATALPVDPKQSISCKLIEKECLTHDIRRLRFSLPSEEQVLGLPVGKHVMLSATINGKLCMRAYTPTSTDADVGFFELFIRVYFKNVHPSFPEGGLMSQYLDSLEIDDSIQVKGPYGHIHYLEKGEFTVSGTLKYARKMGMLAGGTGITPMFQLIKTILHDEQDQTQLFLIYANRQEEDIMLRKELDRWQEEHENFKVWYVVSNPSTQDWPYSVGFITEKIIQDHLPEAASDTAIFICGPPPMIQYACLPNLDKLGHDKDNIYQF